MGSDSSRPAGQLIGGRYELEKILGRGGMGVVWQARHTALNTSVAIKFLSGASANQDGTRKRFLTEAQVTAQLKTRHAVQVFDFGVTDDGQPFLVMELLVGEALADRLARETRLSIMNTVRLMGQASRALDRAHALGIVHRDLKPENMFITLDEEGQEQLKVMDFGVAKLIGDLEGEPTASEAAAATKSPLSTFTRTGSLLGTPYYMAPEQVRGSSDLGPRADIWAMGVVTFECLTGHLPFDGGDLAELFARINVGLHPQPLMLNPDLPPSFDAWFAKACAKNPKDRYETATAACAEFALALGVASDHDMTGPGGSLRVAHSTPNIEGASSKATGIAGAFAPTVDVASDRRRQSTPEAPTMALTPAERAAAGQDFSNKVIADPWARSIDAPRKSRAPLALLTGVGALALAMAAVLALRPHGQATAVNPAVPSAPAASSAMVSGAAPGPGPTGVPPASAAGASASAVLPATSGVAASVPPPSPVPRPRGGGHRAEPAPPAAAASPAVQSPSAAAPPAPASSSPYKMPDLGL